MDKLLVSLGPAFAAGFAVQRLLEILDPLAVQILGPQAKPSLKASVLGLASLIAGLALAAFGGLRVLEPLGSAAPGWMDALTTALVVSAGTEGLNSVLKFLGYARDTKKAEAARASAGAGVEIVVKDADVSVPAPALAAPAAA